jgi:hypothetical protein
LVRRIEDDLVDGYDEELELGPGLGQRGDRQLRRITRALRPKLN